MNGSSSHGGADRSQDRRGFAAVAHAHPLHVAERLWLGVGDTGTHTLLFRDPTNQQPAPFLPLRLDDCAILELIAQFKYVDWREMDEATYGQLLTACQPNPPQPSPEKGESEGTTNSQRTTTTITDQIPTMPPKILDKSPSPNLRKGQGWG